ncbi:hypothetical protein [Rhizobium terrae]|uniref:hypothetical protein n=1 Tax=Rhizobium terrae TaxID=2171756 RepID=UPI000E3D36BD|nr:hypothetical protein [Rhizobium terrae]
MDNFKTPAIPQPELVGVPALALDHERYRGELADFDMTDEQKDEMLSIIWSIMSGMVELGFTYDLCGQIFDCVEIEPPAPPVDVESASKIER